MSLRSAFPMLLRAAAQKPAAMMMAGNHANSTGAMISASSSLMPAILVPSGGLMMAGIALPSRGFASSADTKEKTIPLGEPTAHAGVQMHGVSEPSAITSSRRFLGLANISARCRKIPERKYSGK